MDAAAPALSIFSFGRAELDEQRRQWTTVVETLQGIWDRAQALPPAPRPAWAD